MEKLLILRLGQEMNKMSLKSSSHEGKNCNKVWIQIVTRLIGVNSFIIYTYMELLCCIITRN